MYKRKAQAPRRHGRTIEQAVKIIVSMIRAISEHTREHISEHMSEDISESATFLDTWTTSGTSMVNGGCIKSRIRQSYSFWARKPDAIISEFEQYFNCELSIG